MTINPQALQFNHPVQNNQDHAQEPKEDPKLRKVCNDFVSILYEQMLTTMQEAMEVEGGIIENKSGYKDYTNFLFNQIMSKEVIKQNGQGLADTLYAQLSRNS